MAASSPPYPESDVITVPDTVDDHRRKMKARVNNTVKLPSHHHTPLSTIMRGIRLLEVYTGPGFESVCCTLSQHCLDDKPRYIALSYTWDQEGPRRRIQCDGMDYEIGENLWQFLYEFRRKQWLQQYHSEEIKGEICYLWIDALCIDQSNLRERNQQVAQMRDIYTGAESVIVWLGLARAHEELAFLLTQHRDLLKVEQFQNELLGLLRKPYFTRVWVVQEFVLARTVVIWCGELFADVVAFDRIWHEDQVLPGYAGLSTSIVKTPAWPLFKYRRDFRDRRNKSLATKFCLRDLLLSFTTSQSSEAYDKVYGFLGIASPGEHDFRVIHPDYSKPAVEVLIDVLRNQYSRKETATAVGNYELLVFLMRTLQVSRIELARRLLHEGPSVADHLYLLATSDLMSATICKVGMISNIGSFEHVDEYTSSSIKIGLSESSRKIYDLSNSDIQVLASALAKSDPALRLEFDSVGIGYDIIQSEIEFSTHSLMQALYSSKNHDESHAGLIMEDSQYEAKQEDHMLDAATFQKLLSRSLQNGTEAYCTSRRVTARPERAYSYCYYATFVGTNDLMGVLSAECCFGEEPRVYDDIYVFGNGLRADRALIVNGRNFERLEIVGIATIAKKPKPDTGSPIMVQSWQKLFRSSSSENTRSTPLSRDSPQLEDKRAECSFHCSLPELLQLIRCGLLNESQLDHLLKRSLSGDSDVEVHKCQLGTGELPSLVFGT